jgi:uncharacterized membrane protein YeaQ/YmgE (transglycosylase-associated protein family)
MKNVEKIKTKRASIFSRVLNRVDKWLVCSVLFSLTCYNVWAAGDVTKALNSLTSGVTNIFEAATKVMYAVAAIAGIIGAIILYQKWNSGDPNTGKLVGAWIGAAVFLGLVATFLRTMFL